MAAYALRKRLDRLTDFAGGPPRLPFLAIERTLVKRDGDGRLWKKPYQRQVIGSPPELLQGEWEPCDEPEDDIA